MNKIRGIYAITPCCKDSPKLFDQVLQVLEAKVHIIQYRSDLDFATQLYQASQIKQMCKGFKTPFFVNNSQKLAEMTQADGLHIGKGDQLDGYQKMLGISAYDDLSRIQKKATYISIGRVFASRNKKGKAMGVEKFSQLACYGSAPKVAIGGINADNALDLWRAGAAAVAVIDGLFAGDSAYQNAIKMVNVWQEFLNGFD